MDQPTACRVAVADLRGVQARVNAILADLYDSAPAYAGEVESIKEATETAIKVLSGD